MPNGTGRRLSADGGLRRAGSGVRGDAVVRRNRGDRCAEDGVKDWSCRGNPGDQGWWVVWSSGVGQPAWGDRGVTGRCRMRVQNKKAVQTGAAGAAGNLGECVFPGDTVVGVVEVWQRTLVESLILAQDQRWRRA